LDLNLWCSFSPPHSFSSQTHLPGFVDDAEKFKAAGAELVACVSVNDPFVMAAWGEAAGAAGKVMMLADPQADFSKVSPFILSRSSRWPNYFSEPPKPEAC